VNVRAVALTLIRIDNKETHWQWVPRITFYEARMAGSLHAGHFSLWQLKHLGIYAFKCYFEWIWKTLMKICTGLSVDYDPKILVTLLSLSESEQYLICDSLPIPASICHSQNEDFSGNIKTLFLFHQFPLNVLCNRYVLFSTLDCWTYEFFLVWVLFCFSLVWVLFCFFHKTPLRKNYIY
jgi:hypothetical protein